MSTGANLRALALAAAAALLAGCLASARYVVIDPAGGTVAVSRNTPAYRAKALELIAQKCPGGYDIVREQEFVTGNEVTNESRLELDPVFKEARTTQNVRSRSRTEWRITFTCR